MKCPRCGADGAVELLTSVACDACDRPGGWLLRVGYVANGPAYPPGEEPCCYGMAAAGNQHTDDCGAKGEWAWIAQSRSIYHLAMSSGTWVTREWDKRVAFHPVGECGEAFKQVPTRVSPMSVWARQHYGLDS